MMSYQNCFISADDVWKKYYSRPYIIIEENKVSYNNENVMCSNSIFSKITATIATLSGSTLALFHSVEFSDCIMNGQKHAIECSCYGLTFLKCAIRNYNATSTSYFLYLKSGFRYDAHVQLCSFANCGDIKKDHKCIYTVDGLFETTELNYSHCRGKIGSTMRIDSTSRGSYHHFLRLSWNTASDVVVTFEMPFNVVRNAVVVNNGDEKTMRLLYTSNAINEFWNCFFDKNTGSDKFFNIYSDTKRIVFIECFLQPMFGEKKNNALSYEINPVDKEKFEFLALVCNERIGDCTIRENNLSLLVSIFQIAIIINSL